MAPNQRLALVIMWSILLLWVGRLWLFTSLTTQPEEIATNIQGELDDKIAQEQTENNQPSGTPPVNKPITPLPTAWNSNGSQLPTPFPLTILLPPWVNKTYINDLFSRLDPEKNFAPTVLQPTSRTAYLRAVDAMTTGSRQADLILLPREEIDRIHAWSTQIDRSATTAPTGQFHPQIGKLLTASRSMFVPHALDPRVTLTQAPTRNLSLGTFLQTHRSPLLISTWTANNSPLLHTLGNIWLEQLFSASNISLVSKVFLASSSDACTLMRTCMSSWATALRLPLSELNQADVDTRVVSRFPTLDDTMPTTVRWRTIRGNDAPPFIQQRLLRIQNYLTVMSNDQLPYEASLLPAYFPRLKRLILQDEWSRIQPSLYKLSLLEYSSKALSSRFDVLPLTKLIDGSYRAELYLEKRQEIRTQQ